MGDERDLSHHPSTSHFKSDTCECSSLSLMESLGSYGETKTSQTSNERKKDLATFQPSDPLFEDSKCDHEDNLLPTSFGKQKLTHPRKKVKQNHKSPADHLFQTKPFSLILPRSVELMCKRSGKKQVEMENSLESSSELILIRSGMVLLKNYLSLSEQVDIVKKCEELGVGPGGFYQPGYQDGPKLRLQMMCLGRNWDPQTKYEEYYRSDGSEAPPIPDEFIGLVKNALQHSQSLVNSEDELPMMSPDVCIVNFYATSGRLGLHQDRDESFDSLSGGLPVVSVSVGDSADFLYDDKRDVENAVKILLESGDVLIFGGKSRHIFHGVKAINPNSAPLPLLKQTMLRPGRLNLTFRQF